MSAGKSFSSAICLIGPGCSAGEAEVSRGTVATSHRDDGLASYKTWRSERMIMDHVEFDREPPRNLTTLVMAFGGWIDAGRAATGALQHLVSDLPATRLACIDPEDFFVFTQERPQVRLRPDGSRDIQWPRSEFFAWSPGDGRDGLLLFSGPEPHERWQTYTKA